MSEAKQLRTNTEMNAKGEEEKTMEKRELNREEMGQVTGGQMFGKIWKGIKGVKKEPCPKNNNNPHDYVFTGVEKEESYLVFWSKHYKQYKCSHCGKILLVHEN